MDWVSILLIVVFFILPLIQQGLEQARKSRMPPNEDTEMGPEEYPDLAGAGAEHWDPEELPVPSSTPSAPPPQRVEGAGSWSDGWAKWPAPEEPRQERRAPAAEKVPVKLAGALSPPPPLVARDLQVRQGILGREVRVRPSPPRTTKVIQKVTPHPSPRLSLARQLASPAGLKRAIVLKEVLGPPISLRVEGDTRPS